MGRYDDVHRHTLIERIEGFTSDNKDTYFQLVAGEETLSINRPMLVQLLAKIRKDKQFMSQIRAIFHELSK